MAHEYRKQFDLYDTSLGYVQYSKVMTEAERDEYNVYLRESGSQSRWVHTAARPLDCEHDA